MLWYQTKEYIDYKLWEYFQEDFQDQTKNIFAYGNIDSLREFRNYLREYSVFILKDGKRIAENLAKVAAEKDYHDWTEEEIDNQLQTSRNF